MFDPNSNISDSRATLIAKNKLLLKNKKVADVFSYLNGQRINGSTDQIYDSIDRIIDSFRFNPSLNNVKRNYKITSNFSFKSVSGEFVRGIGNDLSLNKAAGGEIPLKIFKGKFFLTHCTDKL